MLTLLLAAVFLCEPCPWDMPRASAYQVTENGVRRLEDRYEAFEQWTSRSSLGTWSDADGRYFSLYSLDTALPPIRSDLRTRLDYAAGLREIKLRKSGELDRAAALAALMPPSCVGDTPLRLRQLPRNCADFEYFVSTNESVIAAAFLPKDSKHWLFAVWELAPGDSYPERFAQFEQVFLEKELPRLRSLRHSPPPKHPTERELLRADARHSVTNYANWHVTDGEEFTVLDDLNVARSFVTTLTNDMTAMRAKYKAAFPSPVVISNVLSVARIYANRSEYVAALDDDMMWSAAYWSPVRRELVAYLPPDGSGQLIENIRHEAFHQYLSYATLFRPVSPWLNEGYAQYFEDEGRGDWHPTEDQLKACAEALPGLLAMDYEQFYAGTDEERRLKYRLAWSIAWFLEKGAAKVRFAPFKDLRTRYLAELLKGGDMRRATAYAFETKDKLDDFVSEWLKFWTK